ncbi:MAG: hypothetical protein ABS35_24270 [Kaistia sp. SCN 65-12]|nr:MAG: hypothetical protein ABS35_24270 [Kaistia sp. SCN 65-12]
MARIAATEDRLTARLKNRLASLSPALRRVAVHIDGNRLDAMTKPATELALALGISDATVIRAVKALGYSGLPELKRELAASFGKGASPADNMQRTLSLVEGDVEQTIDFVLSAQQSGISQLAAEGVRARISSAVRLLEGSPRIAVFGVGPTAFLAEYAAALLARNGRLCHILRATGGALADQLLHLAECKALLIMAYGRAYKEAAVTIEEARRLKLPIVLISDSLDQRLARYADVTVPAPRGATEHVALHGATVACLEALIVGIAAADQANALATLEKLNELRKAIAPASTRAF